MDPLAPSQAATPATKKAIPMMIATEITPIENGTAATEICVATGGVLLAVSVAVEVGQGVAVGRRVGVEVGEVGVGVKTGRMINCLPT